MSADRSDQETSPRFNLNNPRAPTKKFALEGWTAREEHFWLRTLRVPGGRRRPSHSATMKKDLRDNISEDSKRLIRQSKELIE